MKHLAVATILALSFLFDSCNDTYQGTRSYEYKSIPVATVPVEVQPNVVEPNVVEPTTVHIDFTFIGDVMLAEYKGQRTKNGFFEVYDKNGEEYCFSNVKQYFEDDDFTIANIENVFTDEKLSERHKDENPGYWYKAPTSYAEGLVAGSIEVGNLNNNHTRDYGTAGQKDTQSALEDLGILTGGVNRPCYFEKDGVKIGLVCVGLWSNSQAEGLKKEVSEVKSNCDICIVYFHGGEMKVHEPDAYKIKGAHNAVDAGADLVVGCHPHVLQPSEVYNGVTIVYSLGNFCYGGSTKPENRTIIYEWLIDVDVSTKSIVSQDSLFIPCYVYTGKSNNYQPALIDDEEEKQKVIDFMLGNRKNPF